MTEKQKQDSLQQHGVYDLIRKEEVPAGAEIIGSGYIYKIKADGRFKARLVVCYELPG